MASSSNNIDTGSLYFGSVNPTVTGQEVDNDSFIVTSNGTPTGIPISFWKFDEETLTWVRIPTGNPITVIDNANGTVTINAGGTNIQDAQRPILELPILARNLIDSSADYDDVWDASANRMVRVLATRASQVAYLADGLNNTRAGSLGTVGSSTYAVFDHVHPIIAITAPATPIITASGTGLVITSQNLVRTLTEDESVTFHLRLVVTQTVSNAWNALIVPNIAGYKAPNTLIGGTYRSSGNPNLGAGFNNAPSMVVELTNYQMSNVLYFNCPNRTQGTTIDVALSIEYILA